MNNGPDSHQTADMTARSNRAIELWQRAKLGGGVHNTACRCGGIPHLALPPGYIEQALLDYLIAKYAAQAHGGVARLVQSRLDALEKDQKTGSFEQWLRNLPHENLPPRSRETLLDDILWTLSSLVGQDRAPRPPRSRFECLPIEAEAGALFGGRDDRRKRDGGATVK